MAHLFTHSHTLNHPKTVCRFGGPVVAAVVQFSLFQSFWYFLLCTILGEGVLSWLFVGYGVASWNHSFCQRLRCLGVALCLWLGDNGVALSMVKRAHQHYCNTFVAVRSYNCDLYEFYMFVSTCTTHVYAPYCTCSS